MICLPAVLIVLGMAGDIAHADYCNPWRCYAAAAQINEQTSNAAVCRMRW